MVLTVGKSNVEELIRHSKEVFPMEACGIMVGVLKGDNKMVQRIYKTRNILNSTSKYLVDSEEQYRIFLEAEKNSLEVCGFYHSHPYWPAQISETDKSQVSYPNLSYLIYSIPENDLKSWVLKNKKFELEKIEVT